MMRELEQKPATCFYCGAPAEHLSLAEAADGVGWRAWSFSKICVGAGAVERQRSGLAYAAGFASLFFLFHYSFATLLFAHPGLNGLAGMSLAVLWSLSAPAAVVLAYAAGISLDRSPEKAGRLPALFGLLVGLYGTFHVTAELSILFRAFGRF